VEKRRGIRIGQKSYLEHASGHGRRVERAADGGGDRHHRRRSSWDAASVVAGGWGDRRPSGRVGREGLGDGDWGIEWQRVHLGRFVRKSNQVRAYARFIRYQFDGNVTMC
jgi:hypothetical protein